MTYGADMARRRQELRLKAKRGLLEEKEKPIEVGEADRLDYHPDDFKIILVRAVLSLVFATFFKNFFERACFVYTNSLHAVEDHLDITCLT